MNIKKEVRNFPDGNHVEYATILIDLAYKFIPSIIREEDSTCNEDEIIKGLYVTPTGRITWHTLYLNNRQLAENLVKHLNVIFKKRYGNNYTLRIVIQLTSEKVTATKGKIKHSSQVIEILNKVRN